VFGQVNCAGPMPGPCHTWYLTHEYLSRDQTCDLQEFQVATWPGRLRQIHSFFRTRSPDQMLAAAAPWTSPWLPPRYEQDFWNAALAVAAVIPVVAVVILASGRVEVVLAAGRPYPAVAGYQVRAKRFAVSVRPNNVRLISVLRRRWLRGGRSHRSAAPVQCSPAGPAVWWALSAVAARVLHRGPG
jgi:hypothetical protein